MVSPLSFYFMLACVPFPEAVGNSLLRIHSFSWSLPLDQAVSLPLSLWVSGVAVLGFFSHTHLCAVHTEFSE